MSMMCFGRTFHMKGALAVMADEVFWGLACALEHAEHVRLLFKGGNGSHWLQEHER